MRSIDKGTEEQNAQSIMHVILKSSLKKMLSTLKSGWWIEKRRLGSSKGNSDPLYVHYSIISESNEVAPAV